jgi:hypothetical protein
MVSWIGERVDLDARPGGRFAVNFGATAADGSYVAVEPPHRVVFTWGIPDDAAIRPGSSTVAVVVLADGDDTIVNLTHSDARWTESPLTLRGGRDALPPSPLPFVTSGFREYLRVSTASSSSHVRPRHDRRRARDHGTARGTLAALDRFGPDGGLRTSLGWNGIVATWRRRGRG